MTVITNTEPAFTTKYDMLIASLQDRITKTEVMLTDDRERLKQASYNAVCELLGLQQGDVIAVTFGTKTLDWKVWEADGNGAVIRLVTPVPNMLGERVLRLSDVCDGKYIGRINKKV